MRAIIVVTRVIRFRTLSALVVALLLADRRTGTCWAGMVGGSLLAFNTHLLTRLPHCAPRTIRRRSDGVLAKLASEPRLELIAADAEHRLYRFTSRPRQP